MRARDIMSRPVVSVDARAVTTSWSLLGVRDSGGAIPYGAGAYDVPGANRTARITSTAVPVPPSAAARSTAHRGAARLASDPSTPTTTLPH